MTFRFGAVAVTVTLMWCKVERIPPERERERVMKFRLLPYVFQ